MSDKNKPGPLSHIFDNEAYLSGNAIIQWITGTLCIAFFILLGFLDSQLKTVADIGVILSQVQVFISIFLTIRIKKWGYVLSVLLNLLLILSVSLSGFNQPGIHGKPMVIVPISTIFIISIIYLFIVNYHRKIDEITVKNQKMAEQNDLLTAYNQIIKSNEEKLSRMAFIDMLTELPNRKMLINRIDQLITSIEEPDLHFALAFIDLDDFKQVNDTLGHHVGDLLLQGVSAKLKDAIHDDDMLGRLGGDEFALIIKRPLTDAALFSYIENLRQQLIDDLIIENRPLPVRASFGLSRYPEDGSTSAELLKSADHAMYQAKTHKTAGIEFFNQKKNAEPSAKLDYTHYFNLALENNEFYQVFQPQFAADSRQLRGFEVLTRWNSGDLGNVSPEIFLPIAEKNGLMPLLGQWILHTACEKYQKFKSIYDAPLIMSIHISAVELLDPGFVPMVKTTLAKAGMVGSNLEFEISESTFMAAPPQLAEVIKELRLADILISLDDFGKIMSYINELQTLSIDTINIAQNYIDAINDGNETAHLLAAMVLFAHQLKLEVFAKGVQTQTQADYLQQHQCDYLQGSWWSGPLDDPDFSQLLRTLPI
ncbi:bifunctional diguanylate cyclase/phosphodiesterase [Acetobacterium wieringae]|uniref:putative bifunctional diguanylate cyclase/phosphodiesterase n=1 Tax=Acetobacterium wieringae TaxID=52694 RepID=UPI0026EC4FC1|nr:GGDEF and EAL domain-containing protein [Acetobacterium wieringae]